MIETLQRQLCDIQGRLFELSAKEGYDSGAFISFFMCSQTAAYFDLPYDRLQWAGEEYILEEIVDEAGSLPKTEHFYPGEVLYWTGYLYRYWHFLTGECSKEIYGKADAKTMRETYPGFHTLDNTMAVENLEEIFRQKRRRSNEIIDRT